MCYTQCECVSCQNPGCCFVEQACFDVVALVLRTFTCRSCVVGRVVVVVVIKGAWVLLVV